MTSSSGRSAGHSAYEAGPPPANGMQSSAAPGGVEAVVSRIQSIMARPRRAALLRRNGRAVDSRERPVYHGASRVVEAASLSPCSAHAGRAVLITSDPRSEEPAPRTAGSGGTAGGGWIGIVSSSTAAVVVGFASTILLILEAARAVGATPAQQVSWAAALCFGMAVTTLVLSWRYRMPIIVAWSTPGAVLLATSAAGVPYDQALGAFATAGLLTCAAALVKPLA